MMIMIRGANSICTKKCALFLLKSARINGPGSATSCQVSERFNGGVDDSTGGRIVHSRVQWETRKFVRKAARKVGQVHQHHATVPTLLDHYDVPLQTSMMTSGVKGISTAPHS